MDLSELKDLENGRRHPWELARLQIIKKQLRSLRKKRREASLQVLDIGCGDAFVVASLAADFQEMQFSAVDINFTEEQLSELNIAHAGKNLAFYQNLTDIPSSDHAKTDLVMLLDVIEHIEDDLGFMSSLHQHDFITNETDFLIMVPAYPGLYSSHDDVLGHYRRYTNESLKAMLINGGFRTRHLSYFFASLLPLRYLQVREEKRTGTKKEHERSELVQWTKGPFLTNLVTSILTFDYTIGRLLHRVGVKMPGLSNLCICSFRES